MKNICLFLLGCLVLNGCIRAGDYDLIPVRKKIFNLASGYWVDFIENDDEFIGSQPRREHDYVLNKAVTVKKGDTMVSDKLFNTDTYQRLVYRPIKNGAVSSNAHTFRLRKTGEYTVVGTVNIDGVKYRLLETDITDYVYLFDEDGKFYNKAGYIDDGVLKLVDGDVFVYPKDLKMQVVAVMKDEDTNIKTGYELKYAGVKLDRIWFDYLDYDDDNPSGGKFEKISFPNKPGLIKVNDLGLRVLKADDNLISFMVLTDSE